MPDSGVFSVDEAFKVEIRRRDGIIRGLGAEAEQLAKDIDSRKTDLELVNKQVMIATDQLSKLDDALKAKTDQFSASCEAISANLSSREGKVAVDEQSIVKRQSALDQQAVELNTNVNSFNSLKSELIEKLTELDSGISGLINNFKAKVG